MAETYVSSHPMSADELAVISDGFESAPASAAIRWAVKTFGDSLVLAASFEDIVLIDLVTKAAPSIEVVFLDTEAHFPETLSFVDEVQGALRPEPDGDQARPEAAAHPCGSEQCCQFRKVEPLRRALAGKRAWLTSLRRSDGPTRADAPIVSWDTSFGLVKVNPLVTWTDRDIASYLADHGLPVHPLVSRATFHRLCTDHTSGDRGGRCAGPAARRGSTSPSVACTSSAT